MSVLVHGLQDPTRPDVNALSQRRMWSLCWKGEMPSEAMALIDPKLVDQLVYDLWALDWSDVQIAAHTCSTTYTTGRIRARLGLAANQDWKGAVA